MKYFEKGNFFPPEEAKERLKRYEENKLLFEGRHRELVDRYNLNPRSRLYISVNLAGLISKKSADFLIGDGITVSAGKDGNSPEQEALERIYESNSLDVRLYESALGNSYRGDSFFKVRYGYEIEGGDERLEIGERMPHIESIPAKYVFPEISDYNAKKHLGYHIAIPMKVKEDRDGKRMGDWELVLESHYPNRILYSRKELKVIRTDYDGTPIEWKIGKLIKEPKEELTGIPFPLIVHIPNYATDDTSLGLDDLTEIRPLFDELNNRLTQIANILDKHSDPAIAIPHDIMEVDDMGRPIFKVSESKVFEVNGKDDIIPQYITWNGQLQEAYSELDRITNEILTVAELPEVALGRSGTGTSGSSGFAIKWRMNSLLSKVKRKRMYYNEGLKQVLLLAQMVEQEAKGTNYSLTIPKLVFTDGLPKDEAEQTSIYLQKTGGAVLKSRKTALKELEGLTEEQAEAEIAQILLEEKEAREREQETKGDTDLFNKINSLYEETAEDPMYEEIEKEELLDE